MRQRRSSSPLSSIAATVNDDEPTIMADPSAERFLLRLVTLLKSLVSWLIAWISNLLFPKPTLVFDSKISVKLGNQIAEGGFSYVFEATDSQKKLYAVKRMNCVDDELLREAEKEAAIHRAVRHENAMPLLGIKIDSNSTSQSRTCYMLFPYMPHSLRQELNRRVLTNQPQQQLRPFSQIRSLQLGLGIARGLHALHSCNYSHRDVKVDNVLLDKEATPVLMDFGSAGPLLSQPLENRRNVLSIADEAAQHTTLPYRPPELLEGSLRVGDEPVDYTKVDVWSLGCTLFAILYGASPFEVEFRSNAGICIVDCGSLRILGNIPRPNPSSDLYSWCSDDLFELIEWMLTKDRAKRPGLKEVMDRMEKLLVKMGGTIPPEQQNNTDHPDSDLDDLLGSSNYV